VRIKNAKTVQSIGCHDKKPWLIKEDTSKIKLISDTCFHICANEPNDEILSVLPEQMKNKSESADVSSFLCSMLERYRHNMIYTPSDLFEIHWDITEDHSLNLHDSGLLRKHIPSPLQLNQDVAECIL
jgi:hypothetical protein